MAGKKAAGPDPIAVVNDHVSKNEYSRVYLFMGPEAYLLNQFRDKLISAATEGDDMNLVRFGNKGVDVKSLISECDTMPFFSDHRVIVVTDSDLFKSAQDELAEYIPNLPDSTVLVFSEKNVDKKFKLYKAVDKAGTVLNFETPDADSLVKWIAKLFGDAEIKVDKAAAGRIVEVSGEDMMAISNEVEKLISYCHDKGAVTIEDVNTLCVSDAEDKVFDMIDAISAHNTDKALKLYTDLLSLKEAPVKILALINMNYMRLATIKMMEKDGAGRSEIAKYAKVPPFLLGKYQSQSRNYTYKELLQILEKCQETGRILRSVNVNKDRTLEIFILKLCNNQ